MKVEFQQYEAHVEEEIKAILSELSANLKQNHITRETIEIRRADTPAEAYWSEIEIDFWRGDEFFDVLEFFIFQNGCPHASIAEIVSWFRNEIDRFLNKADEES